MAVGWSSQGVLAGGLANSGMADGLGLANSGQVGVGRRLSAGHVGLGLHLGYNSGVAGGLYGLAKSGGPASVGL